MEIVRTQKKFNKETVTTEIAIEIIKSTLGIDNEDFIDEVGSKGVDIKEIHYSVGANDLSIFCKKLRIHLHISADGNLILDYREMPPAIGVYVTQLKWINLMLEHKFVCIRSKVLMDNGVTVDYPVN